MTQYAVPNSTNITDEWTGNVNGTNIHLDIDDGIDGGSITTASYATISSMGFGQTKTCELGLESLDEPADDTNHIIKVHAKHNGLGGTLNIGIALYEGSTSRYSGTITVNNSFSTYTLNIPETGAANIGSYSNLRIRMSAVWNGASPPHVAEIEFQAPDAAGGGGGPISDPTNPSAFIMFL